MYLEHLVHLRWASGMILGMVTDDCAVLLAFLLTVCFIQCSGLEPELQSLLRLKGVF